ncbi:MAG TPA: hypothetical protein VK586_24760 [Streptosporangiaceae bacterium]|nr:hypothetical protein [Streptosporangiaceae bacterium]
MRASVLCCFTRIDPRVTRALGPAEYVGVSGDPLDYWRAIDRRWTGAVPLVVVEHDVEVGPLTVPGLIGCDEPWCTVPYPVWTGSQSHYTRALGCAKFAPRLQQYVPAAAFAGRWQHLADYISELFGELGIPHHLHDDPVSHHHKEPRCQRSGHFTQP